MRKILIADDEVNMRWALERALKGSQYDVETCEDGLEAVSKALSELPDLVLLDLKMPKLDGLSVLRELKQYHPNLLVIIMTAHGSTSDAVDAMKNGAYDYLQKPIDMEELLLTVNKAFEMTNLKDQVDYLKNEVTVHSGWEHIVGNSLKMKGVYELVQKVAPTSATVLVQGESGTGKELVAHAIYALSPRQEKPFIRINCAALPETLMESELFGHEKGAFTGAHARKSGRFELADEGTLFLDEIGELSLSVQAKLLRVLQEKTFERVGGEKTIKVDVRIIAATNRDLRKEVAGGRFREDLYYRLNVFPILVPPLRERKEDIPILVDHFLHRYSPVDQKKVSPFVLKRLVNYDWPGNVRELQNVIERMIIICQDNEIKIDCLPDFLEFRKLSDDEILLELPDEGINLEILEKGLLRQALERTGGNQTKAADLLGLTRPAFLYRMEKYGIKFNQLKE